MNERNQAKPGDSRFVQDSLPESGVPPQEKHHRRVKKRNFYARAFTRMEVSDLDVLNAEKLFDEIALMRVTMRRCFEAASTRDPEDLESWSQAVTVLGTGTTRLAALLRSQQLLGQDGKDAYLKLISKALTIVRKEWNICPTEP
jgi:hypothetical protein